MKLFLKYAEDNLPSWPTTILEDLGIAYSKNIVLGELVLTSTLTQEVYTQLQKKLAENGFTILFDRKDILVHKIKYVIYSMLEGIEFPVVNTSIFISDQIHLNYTYLANVFSKAEGITIERFIIMQKIEKAKRLLVGYEYEISQVATALHYSSIGHFCNQFKKITGVTPTEFKQQLK